MAAGSDTVEYLNESEGEKITVALVLVLVRGAVNKRDGGGNDIFYFRLALLSGKL